jgi:hypothetical protein
VRKTVNEDLYNKQDENSRRMKNRFLEKPDNKQIHSFHPFLCKTLIQFRSQSLKEMKVLKIWLSKQQMTRDSRIMEQKGVKSVRSEDQ